LTEGRKGSAFTIRKGLSPALFLGAKKTTIRVKTGEKAPVLRFFKKIFGFWKIFSPKPLKLSEKFDTIVLTRIWTPAKFGK